MCGIAGIYGSEPIPQERVERMLQAIAYRGRDNLETRQFRGQKGGHLTVGQVRLAIMDPRPEANQPFCNLSGTAQLTFNGEFYNFQALRSLWSDRFEFKTQSDTEVALLLLEHLGVQALDQLYGMFAGSFYETQKDRLLLFLDRYGKKPLYFYQHQGLTYFASEPKGILAVLDHTPAIDVNALSDYFYLGYLPPDRSIFQGMRRLTAGQYMEISPQGSSEPKHWYRESEVETLSSEAFEATFMDAVRLRMISDVPLGAFLSGGVDSSLVVAAMARLAPKVHTFSIRFAGPQVLDESPFARLVAQHCQTEHHEIVMDVDQVQALIPEVLNHFDEPFGDSSAVPTFLVSREARKHFTVALTGDGADEIFGGYRKYLGEHYLRKLGPYSLRRWLWQPLLNFLPTGRTHPVLENFRRVHRLLMGDAAGPAQRHINWLHPGPIPFRDLKGPQLPDETALREKLLSHFPSQPDLNDSLRLDQILVLPGDMLVKLDRMSMKASLELRSPFLDHRLVRFANQLPVEAKIRGTQRKRILQERLGHLLPPSIFNRPKSGFEMPIGAWLRGPLKKWAEHLLFHTVDSQAYVNPEALKGVWARHQSGKMDATEPLWFQLVFANWLDRYHRGDWFGH